MNTPMNLTDLNDSLKSEHNVFWFIINQKIIDNEKKCFACNNGFPMVLIRNNQAKMGHIWKCPICWKTKSIFSGSIFQDSKLSVPDMLTIIFCWSNDFSVQTTSLETKVSGHTISAVFNQMKNACYLEIEKFL